jgi:hypothetical protein
MLVWFDHSTGDYYEVNHTDPRQSYIDDSSFRKWCSPFEAEDYSVLEAILVAEKRHRKQPNKYLEAHGLPKRYVASEFGSRWSILRLQIASKMKLNWLPIHFYTAKDQSAYSEV